MMGRLHQSALDLDAGLRERIVLLLNPLLAEAIDLQLQAKQAHWNVRSPHFAMLHTLFDGVYEVVAGYVDELAERITTLAGVAEGTLAACASASKLPPYPLDVFGGEAHLRQLLKSVGAFGKAVRAGITRAAEAGDDGTADLLTEISRAIDKQHWLLEAHLQGPR